MAVLTLRRSITVDRTGEPSYNSAFLAIIQGADPVLRAGMRFEPEVCPCGSRNTWPLVLIQWTLQSADPANAGLHHAISFLMPIQTANPWITHSDLWSKLIPNTIAQAYHLRSSRRYHRDRGSWRTTDPLEGRQDRLRECRSGFFASRQCWG